MTSRAQSPDVVCWAPLDDNGVGIFFSGLCRTLSDHSLRVVAITHSREHGLRSSDKREIPVVEVHSVRDYFRVCLALSRLRRTVLIYHLSLSPGTAPIFAILLRLLGRLPMIPTIAGSDWFDSHRPRLLSGSVLDRLTAFCIDRLYLLLSSGASIVASSREMLLSMNRLYGVSTKHLALVPNAVVDFDLFSDETTRNMTRESNTILFVGRLSEENGVDVLVKSMKTVVQSVADTKLVVVGGGPLRRELIGLTERLGLDRNVEIVGNVSRHEVPRYMMTATVAAFPFIWRAGAGSAVYEAMAMGLPVVISAANATIRDLVESRCVMGIPAENEAALAKGILRFLDDSSLREAYSVNALGYIRKNMSSDRVAFAWQAAIQKAMKLAGSPAPKSNASQHHP